MAHFSRVKATTLRAKQAGSIPAPDTTYNTQVSQIKFFKMEKKMINAQAQLLQRASILMVAGTQEDVYTSCHPHCNIFSFIFAGIELCFDDEHPFNDDEVEKAITKLDTMIDDLHRRSEFAVSVIKAWRG